MEIYSAKTVSVEKWVKVAVNYGAKDFDILVKMEDGKVVGDGLHQLYTSYLTYFNDTPDSVKQEHFEKIKDYVENHIK